MGFGDVNNVLIRINTYLFSWFEIESLVILSVLLSAAADERLQSLHWWLSRGCRLQHIHIDWLVLYRSINELSGQNRLNSHL